MNPHRGRAQGVDAPAAARSERHRILWLFLQRETDILTAAALRSCIWLRRECWPSLLQRPNIEYVSGDLEPGRAMEVMDITALPSPG